MWAAKSTPEFKLGAAKITALVGISAVEAVTGNPEANAAVGLLIAKNVQEWKKILQIPSGGGLAGHILPSKGSALIQNFTNQINLINFKKIEFQTTRILKYQDNCQIIQSNILTEHSSKRFLYGQPKSKQLKIVKDIGSIAIIPLTGRTFLATGIVTFTVFGSLYLFNRAEKDRFKRQAAVIDVVIRH